MPKEMSIIKLENIIFKEARNIAFGVAILSTVMLIVFLILGRLNFSVVISAFIGSFLAVINFWLLGISLNKAISKNSDNAKQYIQLFYSYRMIGLFVVLAICLYSKRFTSAAILLPLIFPRIVIGAMNFKRRRM